MDEDGCAILTFFKNVREWENTILVVKDEHGWVFGCVCTDYWRPVYSFFGNSDNMLFTFRDTDEPTTYYWTGAGSHHMYTNADSIGIGGSLQKGRFALYLHHDFSKGSSVSTEMFDN